MDEGQVATILRAYDLGELLAAEPLDCDPRRPWKAVTERGEFVVKECRLNNAPEDLRFEHGLLAWLAGQGFPAACALTARCGGTWVEKTGELFAVYDLMPGQPFATHDIEQAKNAGACLARFHQIADTFEGARARRPPLGYRRPGDDAATLRNRWPDRAEIAGLCEDFLRLERELLAHPLEEALLFNDLRPENIVFDGSQVAGVFDLECCYWGPRLLDVSNSALWFGFVETSRQGVAEHEDELDLACTRAFMKGYKELHPLPDQERQLLPTALRHRIRCWAVFDLVDAEQPGRWNDSEWRHSAAQIRLVDTIMDSSPFGP